MEEEPILLIGDNVLFRDKLKTHLMGVGIKLIWTTRRTGWLELIKNRKILLVILEYLHEGCFNGLSLVSHIRNLNKNLPIILLANHSSEEILLAALRLGVNDFFKWPFALVDLSKSIKKNLIDQSSPVSGSSVKDQSFISRPLELLGDSKPMRELKTYISKVALTDCNVLITGETGTGKELAGELIHLTSPRRQKPFVCINCVALPENLLESELFGYERGAFTGAVFAKPGKFEVANEGTIFLDEIGDMSLHSQAKILRAIERREVCHLGGTTNRALNIRIIAATNRNLEGLMQEGRFRADLFYRLNISSLQLPPLRGRKGDIPLLVNHYIKIFNKHFGVEVQGVTKRALMAMVNYHWPGNVRELKNLMEASFINVSSERIDTEDFPLAFQVRLSLGQEQPASERSKLLSALVATKWNKSKAANELNWSRTTLYRKMAEYEVVPDVIKNE